jgi:NAD/NADP transhydrogenase beta subunit
MFDQSHPIITTLYIIASVLFIVGLKMLNRAVTAAPRPT